MKKVEIQILNELASSKKTIWELLESTNFPLKDFTDAVKSLYEKKLVAADSEGLYLTEKGREVIDPRILEFESKICPRCSGKRVVFGEKFRVILKDFRRIVKSRPRPTLNFFQGYMQERDVIARVALMHHYGDVHRKEFVLIGDDDLLSIALSLTHLPDRILVLDIDERLGEFIRNVNREYGFDIEFRKYNVADPLPNDLIGNFDVFSSEPLETLSGLRAFIGRGVSCLKENGVGYFGLTILEASNKKWLAVQKLLVRMNCLITDVIRGFSVYPMDYGTVNYEKFAYKLGFPVGKNPGINWYKSALYRFEVLGAPKFVVDPKKRLRLKFIDPEEDITHPMLY